MKINNYSIYFLLFVGLIPWCFVYPGVYHFDDFITPLSDPASQNLSSFFANAHLTLRPVSKLFFAIQGTLDFVSADARRLFGLFIFYICGVQFWRLIRILLPDMDVKLSVMIVFIFMTHPIHAETVLAIAGHSVLLGQLFLFSFFIAIKKNKAWSAALFFVLAVLSRETILIFFPFLFLLKTNKKYIFFIAAVAFIWAISLQRHHDLLEYSFNARSWSDSVFKQISAVIIGLSLYVRPWALTLDHGEQLTNLHFVSSIALLLALCIYAYYQLKKRQIPTAACILLAILPTQTIIPKLDPLTERPFSFAFAAILLSVAGHIKNTPKHKEKLLITFCVLTLFFIIATSMRANKYKTELALWKDAASKTIVNARPWINYATSLIRDNRYKEAEYALKEAYRIDPFNSEVIGKIKMIKYKLLLEK